MLELKQETFTHPELSSRSGPLHRPQTRGEDEDDEDEGGGGAAAVAHRVLDVFRADGGGAELR